MGRSAHKYNKRKCPKPEHKRFLTETTLQLPSRGKQKKQKSKE